MISRCPSVQNQGIMIELNDGPQSPNRFREYLKLVLRILQTLSQCLKNSQPWAKVLKWLIICLVGGGVMCNPPKSQHNYSRPNQPGDFIYVKGVGANDQDYRTCC